MEAVTTGRGTMQDQLERASSETDDKPGWAGGREVDFFAPRERPPRRRSPARRAVAITTVATAVLLAGGWGVVDRTSDAARIDHGRGYASPDIDRDLLRFEPEVAVDGVIGHEMVVAEAGPGRWVGFGTSFLEEDLPLTLTGTRMARGCWGGELSVLVRPSTASGLDAYEPVELPHRIEVMPAANPQGEAVDVMVRVPAGRVCAQEASRPPLYVGDEPSGPPVLLPVPAPTLEYRRGWRQHEHEMISWGDLHLTHDRDSIACAVDHPSCSGEQTP